MIFIALLCIWLWFLVAMPMTSFALDKLWWAYTGENHCPASVQCPVITFGIVFPAMAAMLVAFYIGVHAMTAALP